MLEEIMAYAWPDLKGFGIVGVAATLLALLALGVGKLATDIRPRIRKIWLSLTTGFGNIMNRAYQLWLIIKHDIFVILNRLKSTSGYLLLARGSKMLCCLIGYLSLWLVLGFVWYFRQIQDPFLPFAIAMIIVAIPLFSAIWWVLSKCSGEEMPLKGLPLLITTVLFGAPFIGLFHLLD